MKNSMCYKGLTGIHYCKARKKWEVEIEIDGKFKKIGFFSTAEKAVCAYDAAVVKLKDIEDGKYV